MFGFIGRHWRGDASFWLSLFVVSMALTAFLLLGQRCTHSSSIHSRRHLNPGSC